MKWGRELPRLIVEPKMIGEYTMFGKNKRDVGRDRERERERERERGRRNKNIRDSELSLRRIFMNCLLCLTTEIDCLHRLNINNEDQEAVTKLRNLSAAAQLLP
jgi:hypothetical protein